MESVTVGKDWLSLSDYSSEYGISVSTLRRRIKGHQIKFKMINGKYFLASHQMPTEIASSSVPTKDSTPKKSERVQPSVPTSAAEENTFQTAKVLLDELKKAYMQSLQDKEKQIIHLKQQIADLKTLVMYLERENQRLNPGSRPVLDK